MKMYAVIVALALIAAAPPNGSASLESIAKSIDRLPRCGSSPWWIGKAFPRDARGTLTRDQLVSRIDSIWARHPTALVGYLYVTGDGAYYGAPAPSAISDASLPVVVKLYRRLRYPSSGGRLAETLREGGPPPNPRVVDPKRTFPATEYRVRPCVAGNPSVDNRSQGVRP